MDSKEKKKVLPVAEQEQKKEVKSGKALNAERAREAEQKKAERAKAAKEVKAAIMAERMNAEQVYAVRGNVFEGKVTSAKAQKTVSVERIILHYIPKYERYLKVKSKIKAHNPININAKEGDIVKVGETRKISKTKSFIVMEIVKKATQ